MDISTNLAASLKNGFIDCNMKSIEKYNPKLLVKRLQKRNEGPYKYRE